MDRDNERMKVNLQDVKSKCDFSYLQRKYFTIHNFNFISNANNKHIHKHTYWIFCHKYMR